MRSPQRALHLRLHDMIEAIDRARSVAEGIDFETFAADWIKRLAAERTIEIISEASRHVPDELRTGAPHIPWHQIAGIGNKLRHDYDRVEAETIWAVIQNDLIPLRDAVMPMYTALKAKR
jgi:uncharacterized protein with HEPN domain